MVETRLGCEGQKVGMQRSHVALRHFPLRWHTGSLVGAGSISRILFHPYPLKHHCQGNLSLNGPHK